MKTGQIQIDFNEHFDFTAPVNFKTEIIHKENNAESQSIFEVNKDRFSRQCQIVYDALMRGERLTTTIALVEYEVGDLRRRIKDLKDMWNIPIQSELIKGKYKEYYINLKPN